MITLSSADDNVIINRMIICQNFSLNIPLEVKERYWSDNFYKFLTPSEILNPKLKYIRYQTPLQTIWKEKSAWFLLSIWWLRMIQSKLSFKGCRKLVLPALYDVQSDSQKPANLATSKISPITCRAIHIRSTYSSQEFSNSFKSDLLVYHGFSCNICCLCLTIPIMDISRCLL